VVAHLHRQLGEVRENPLLPPVRFQLDGHHRRQHLAHVLPLAGQQRRLVLREGDLKVRIRAAGDDATRRPVHRDLGVVAPRVLLLAPRLDALLH
jgi:hypothetical protein